MQAEGKSLLCFATLLAETGCHLLTSMFLTSSATSAPASWALALEYPGFRTEKERA